MTKTIIIAERDNIAAVMEDEKVSEFFIHKGEVLMGDVYLARVDNILPSIEATFVDVGYDKMGFLHAEDIIGKGAMKDKVKPNQSIIVQVTKEPVGHKGPRVTMEISLPGRFLVLMPQSTGVNVSRKITSAKERARLKSVVNLIKPVGVGVIVRTEAENQAESEIQEDLEMLLEKWNTIITAAEAYKAPSILHRDQDLLYRVIREACTEDVGQLIVDNPFAHQRATQLLQAWNMNKNIDIQTYKGSQPLLVSSGVAKEIKAALQTKVKLPSGGYLFIQPTEALTVIDVNSGKFTSSSTQDETILKTNIEAIKEIARQLKLRNIGGMVIVDFIDMTKRTDKLAMMQELEIELENDKAKPQVGQLSDLGLIELTRHRQGQSLSEIFTKKCPHCQGTGNFTDEFNFASSTADSEYKAKVAMIKSPLNKKNNYNNNNKNFDNKKGFNKKPANKPIENKPEEIKPIEQKIEVKEELTMTPPANNTEVQAAKEIIVENMETSTKKIRQKRLTRAQKIANSLEKENNTLSEVIKDTVQKSETKELLIENPQIQINDIVSQIEPVEINSQTQVNESVEKNKQSKKGVKKIRGARKKGLKNDENAEK